MTDGEYGDSKKEQSGGKQEHKGERWTRCTLENKLLHVPLITTTLGEKWLAAGESDRPRGSQVRQ
jgi:hypothetical protein